MSESGTGVRALDEVARLLVEDAAASEQRGRGRRPAKGRGPLWLVPRFLAGGLVAAALIAGLVVLAAGGGQGPRKASPATEGPQDRLGPGEYWYARITAGGPRGSTSETWASATGDGRVRYTSRVGRTDEAKRLTTEVTGAKLTYPEVLRLPSDQRRLRAYVEKHFITRPTTEKWITFVDSVLAGPLPVPRATREALMGILLNDPRYRRAAAMTDSAGRRGVGVSTLVKRGAVTLRHWLIFSPSSATLLSSESRLGGNRVTYRTIESAGVVGSTRERPDDVVDKRLVDNFAIFRRAQAARDIPKRSERRLGVDPGLLDFDNARRVGARADGTAIYAVPGLELICMTGGGCAPIDKTVAGRGSFGSSGCNPTQVFALLPDIAANARITDGVGRETVVAVRDNALIALLPSAPGPLSVRWDGPKRTGELGKLAGCPGP